MLANLCEQIASALRGVARGEHFLAHRDQRLDLAPQGPAPAP